MIQINVGINNLMDRTGEVLKNVPHSCHNTDVSWQKQYGKLGCDVPLLGSLDANITVHSHMPPKLGSNGRGVGNFAHFKGSSLINHTMCAYAL